MVVELPEAPDEQHFEVFKSNVPVLEAFFALDGCAWQFTGMGDLIGLDYKAADVIWSHLGISLDKDTFAGLMLFSRTLVIELNKKRQKK